MPDKNQNLPKSVKKPEQRTFSEPQIGIRAKHHNVRPNTFVTNAQPERPVKVMSDASPPPRPKKGPAE